MGLLGRRRHVLVGVCWWVLPWMVGFCWCQGGDETTRNSYVVSSVTYPERRLGPYEWTYVTVEIPPEFSSLAVALQSDIDIEEEQMESVPIMCFRSGSLPIPDITEASLKEMTSDSFFTGSNGSFPIQIAAVQCFPFQRNITMKFTNKQITFGVWYIGYFNGLGPARTQSKMIARGRSHMFSVSIDIKGCITPTMWGPYCNQTMKLLSCGQSLAGINSRHALDTTLRKDYGISKYMLHGEDYFSVDHQIQPEPVSQNIPQTTQINKQGDNPRPRMILSAQSTITCNDFSKTSCIGNKEVNIYSLIVTSPTSLFEIMANEIQLDDGTPVNKTSAINGISLICYARYNAFPSREVHDYSADISHSPLGIQLPKMGTWYISLQAVNYTKINTVLKQADLNASLCFYFEWKVQECPDGKAGLNCSWEKHILQRISRRGQSLPFESYYLPVGDMPLKPKGFSLEPLLSNSSVDVNSNFAWTYFILDIPRSAGGSNLHIQLSSEKKINYEIYLKFAGLPSVNDWDYHANSTTHGNNSMLFFLDESSKETINFYIAYPKEGTWVLGIKHTRDIQTKFQSIMAVSTVKCPRKCSSHGKCKTHVDETGITIYSFCSCDRDHGGFDCSIELNSHQEHIWQSISLIASNGAATLPAVWALREKAFAEWVIFTCSGISSGIYHACDVGTWCPLSFRVLQFLDFWLSFMAVVSTFIYLTTISESSKRALLTGFSILTALLAVNGATRSINIIIVIVIGSIGLLVGWLLEFSSARRCTHFISGCGLNIPERWKDLRRWPTNIKDFLHERFQCYFLMLGFVALSAAGVCWKLENSKNYWIWHSLWHITIYISSFFFLRSVSVNRRNQEHRTADYELTRQNSNSGIEVTEREC